MTNKIEINDNVWQVKITMELPKEFMECFMCGITNAISYWGLVRENKYDYQSDEKVIIDEIVCESTGELKRYEVTDEMIFEGVQKFCKNHPNRTNEIFNMDYDSITQDCVMQYALLGTIVYG